MFSLVQIFGRPAGPNARPIPMAGRK